MWGGTDQQDLVFSDSDVSFLFLFLFPPSNWDLKQQDLGTQKKKSQ